MNLQKEKGKSFSLSLFFLSARPCSLSAQSPPTGPASPPWPRPDFAQQPTSPPLSSRQAPPPPLTDGWTPPVSSIFFLPPPLPGRAPHPRYRARSPSASPRRPNPRGQSPPLSPAVAPFLSFLAQSATTAIDGAPLRLATQPFSSLTAL